MGMRWKSGTGFNTGDSSGFFGRRLGEELEDIWGYEYAPGDQDLGESTRKATDQFINNKMDWWGLFVPKWNARMVGNTAHWALRNFWDPVLKRGIVDPINGDGHLNPNHIYGHKYKNEHLKALVCVKAADKSGNIESMFYDVDESQDVGTYMGAWMEMINSHIAPWAVPKMAYTASLDLKDMGTVAA